MTSEQLMRTEAFSAALKLNVEQMKELVDHVVKSFRAAMDQQKEEETTKETNLAKCAKVVVAGVVGGAVGYATVMCTGVKAIGVLGTGIAVGLPVAAVGIAIGAVTGIALYGLYKLFRG